MSRTALKLGVIEDLGTHYWDEHRKYQTCCGIQVRVFVTASPKSAIETVYAEPTDQPVTCLVCLGAE